MNYYFQRQNHISVFGLQLQTEKLGMERTLKLTFCTRIGTETSRKRYREWVPTKLTKPSTAPAELLGDNERLWKILTSKLADFQHSSDSHKSSSTDEGKVCRDLRDLKPFTTVPNRKHDSFPDIMADPLSTLNEEDYNKWGAQHKKNLLLDAPVGQEDEDDNQ